MTVHRFSVPVALFAATAIVVLMVILSACDDDAEAPPPSASPGTAAARNTETPEGSEELLYARPDGSVWIYDTGTGDQRQIVESGVCKRWSTASWSYDGSMIALTCGTTATSDLLVTHILDAAGVERDRLEGVRAFGWSPATSQLLVLQEIPGGEAERRDQLAIYDPEASGTDAISPIEDASTGIFSPDGTMLAYYRPPDAPCAPGCETGLVILDLGDGSERRYDDVVPAAWTSGDAIIVRPPGASAAAGGDLIMSLPSGEMTPFPGNTGFSNYWVTHDGSRVVFLSQAEDLGLAVLDRETMGVTQVAGSRISYPSDHIPEMHVSLSDHLIYWFDATGVASPWFSARYDGTGLTQLGEAPTLFLTFSARRQFVAYPTMDTSGGESQTTVARIDGTEPVQLGPSGFAMAWRPRGE